MKKLFLVPYGGHGNQLFQASAALALCGNRQVTVLSNWGFARRNSLDDIELESWDWDCKIEFSHSSKPSLLSRRTLNFLLRVGAESRSKVLIRILEVAFSPYFSIILGTRLSIKISRGLGFSDINLKGNTILIGYFQSSKYAECVRDKLISIRPKKISKSTVVLISEIKRKRILVVHFRRGDYINEQFGILDNLYYEKAFKVSNESLFEEIWIFSDEMEIAKQIPAFKSNAKIRFINDEDMDSSEIMEIMRLGDGFIIANSSFSWWAAQLRYKREAHVVCPSPWFKFIDSPAHIIDDEWTQVPW